MCLDGSGYATRHLKNRKENQNENKTLTSKLQN